MSLFKITKESGIPLVGCIAFGIIDRGTNLLQIRPTSLCNLKCVFCSVSANEYELHPTAFQVELDYLMQWIKEIVNYKGDSVEANFDSVGELLTYPDFINLTEQVKKLDNVEKMSMQTNGVILTKEMIDKLESLGMNRINLSINSLDQKKAKFFSGTENYDIKHILEMAEYISKSDIELLLAPVYLPNVNDKDIEDIIKLAKKLNARLGIQKYEVYKYGRKVKEAKKTNWWKFYNKLEEWEKEYDVKLKLTADDLNIEKRKRLPNIFPKNEKIIAEIKAPGWIKNQMIAVAKNRSISVNDCEKDINDKVKIKILENKNELYVAEEIK